MGLGKWDFYWKIWVVATTWRTFWNIVAGLVWIYLYTLEYTQIDLGERKIAHQDVFNLFHITRLKQVVFKGKQFIFSCLFFGIGHCSSVFSYFSVCTHSTDSFFLVVDFIRVYMLNFNSVSCIFLIEKRNKILNCIQSLLQVYLLDKMISGHVTGN